MSSQPPWSETDEPPRDVFDDVPEDGPRLGAHRPRSAPEDAGTPTGLKAMVVVGSLGLLLGAGAYIWSTVSQDDGPAAGRAAGQAQSEPPSPSAAETEPSEEPSAATTAPEDAEQVGVFNATALDGVAGAAGSRLSELEWEIIATGNWGLTVDESVVYYAGDGVTGDTEVQARGIAEALGIEQTQADDAIAYPLVVVVGDDIAQDVLDQAPQAPVEQTGPEQTAPEQEEASLPQEQAEVPTEDMLEDAGAVPEDPAVDDGLGGQPVEEPVPAVPAVPGLPADGGLPAEQVPGAEAPVDQSGGP